MLTNGSSLEYARTAKACIICYVDAQPIHSFAKDRDVISQQQQKLIYIPLICTFILGLFVILFLAMRKRSSKSTSSKKVTKHSVETSPDEALKYWSADKMRNAKAAPLPEVNNLGREKQDPHPSRQQDA